MGVNTVSFGMQGDPEQVALERNLAYAAALRKNAMTPLDTQGRQVGGVAYRISPMEGFAKLAQALQADRLEEAGDADAQSLQTRRAEEGTRDMRGLIAALKGTPATPETQGNNPSAYMPAQEAQAPDSMRALEIAMQSRNPMVQQLGAGIAGSVLPKAPKWEKVEKPNGDGSNTVGFIDVNSSNPWSTFQAGGANPVKREFVNGRGVNPYTGAQDATEVPQQLAPDSIVTRGADGALLPNKPVVDTKLAIAQASRPMVSVDARNFNTQESEQSKAYGKELGDIRAKINQAGFDAPKKLAQLKRMEDLLTGIDGGAAAPTMADMASFAQSFGIKLDPKLGNKQAAEALAREMAGSLRQPGTGPMTDKDFDNFLRIVPNLAKTSEGRKQIMTTMRGAIERDQRAAQFARDYAKRNGGVIDDNFFDTLSGFYAENPVVTPEMPAVNARGTPFADPGKERRYQDWLRGQRK